MVLFKRVQRQSVPEIGLTLKFGGRLLGFADRYRRLILEKCVDCGIALTIRNSMPNGRCYKCHGAHLRTALKTPEAESIAKHELRTYDSNSLTRRACVDAILLTTETAPNLNITRRIEIVTAECAFGMHIFKDLFAGVRNVVGGRSEAVQKTMRDSRRTALHELKQEAGV